MLMIDCGHCFTSWSKEEIRANVRQWWNEKDEW